MHNLTPSVAGVGIQVRLRRHERGMSLEALSGQAPIDIADLKALEGGDGGRLPLSKLLLIAEQLAIHPAALLSVGAYQLPVTESGDGLGLAFAPLDDLLAPWMALPANMRARLIGIARAMADMERPVDLESEAA